MVVCYALMPRKAMPIDERVVAARDALAQYIERDKTNTNALAARFGVPQYTLWRFLAGRTKSVPSCLTQVLGYAGIEVSGIQPPVLRNDERLQRALVSAWDGTPEGVLVLAQLLEAVGPVLRTARGHACP